MRWWRDFERGEVERDFATIAGAGCDSVRIFLLWEDFQPKADAVSDRALARLVEVADVAAANRLDLVPTLFTGHMSGANWIPEWALGEKGEGRFRVISSDATAGRLPLNWYDEPGVRQGQELLAREAAAALRGHPALWAWDLGNENSNVCVPATRDLARSWLATMTNAIRASDPSARVTIGMHMEDLEEDRRLGPAEAAEVSDFLCMHGYPQYAPWARGPSDASLPAYLAQVTRWLGGKDVLFEEFGMPTRTSREEDDADVYVSDALAALHEAGTTGAMVWCFADYVPAIWDTPPLDRAHHERFFGLWRANGSPKPAVRHLARFAGPRLPASPEAAEWADIPPERFYDGPAANLRRMYARYVGEGVAR